MFRFRSIVAVAVLAGLLGSNCFAQNPPRPRGAIPSTQEKILGAPQHRIVGSTPEAWIWIPSKLSMWLNATYGDCVTAEEAFAKACSGIFISDSVVKSWASNHGVLNGASLDQVLDWMAAKGFPQDGNTYNDGAKLSVDYTNEASLRNAIFQGPVKIGVAANQLEGAVGNSNGWFGVGFRVDRNEDHCVSLCGYGTINQLAQWLGVPVPAKIDGTKHGYALFTWNTIGIVDVQSMLNITGEAWLRTPTTITKGTNPPTPDSVFTPTQPTPTPTPNPTPTPTPTPVPVPPPPQPTPGPTPAPPPAPVPVPINWGVVFKDILAVYQAVQTHNTAAVQAAIQQLLKDMHITAKPVKVAGAAAPNWRVVGMDAIALIIAYEAHDPVAIQAAVTKLLADLGFTLTPVTSEIQPHETPTRHRPLLNRLRVLRNRISRWDFPAPEYSVAA